ncbi:hypothetical protein SETIT_3G117600v2 [Setaria italica]|uniref:Uncharacterized protein n=2 Tax=Setaria TaxID=4554 RepID=A0A368QDW8_SETIT|nr:uncharacterized protein LOC105914106 [Setaria italica]XP_034588501.1 uncharacterized protein LOC117850750 [Setaria viridis]RCV16185.1 hypothetical protein SETIT_3G117600v2 [Setaria italica]TKW25439.1 hypothetical protein SEVIR_3G119900v2 [Setaria viridis]
MEMRKKEAGMEMVWGRRRAAPPPEEDDEVERSRSAKAKNDPLSVYEATLLKLRHGSVQAFTAAQPDDGTNGGGDDGAAGAQSKEAN